MSGIFDGNRIQIWDPNTGESTHALNVEMNCRGMLIDGARGGGSLLEFFANRGALLDERQKGIIDQIRGKRASAWENPAEDSAS